MKLAFGKGVNTKLDPKNIEHDEVQEAIGGYYKPESDELFKQRGRTVFGTTASAAKVRGLRVCKFDNGIGDKVIALKGASLFGATPGVGGASNAMTDLLGGRSLVSDHLSTAHALNRWYMTTGVDFNKVLESDGTIRDMGMQAPQAAPVASVVANPSPDIVLNPGAAEIYNDGFVNYGNARDADEDSFARGSVDNVTTAVQATWGGFAPTSPNQVWSINARYRIAGSQISDTDSPFYPPANYNESFLVNLKFEVSGNNGATWGVLSDIDRSSDDLGPKKFRFLTNGTTTPDQIQVRVTLTRISGTTLVSLHLFEIDVTGFSPSAAFDATDIQWAYTEYDENTGRQSPPSPLSNKLDFVAGSFHNQADLVLPATPTNDAATHYIIYRPPQGGSIPAQLGEIDRIPVGAVYQDFFDTPFDVQSLPIVPLLEVGGDLYYRDNPPPQFDYISSFAGTLIGSKGRTLFTALPGRPESWPKVNLIAGFELAERDEIVAHFEVGERAFVALSEMVIILDSLPKIEENRFIATEPRPLTGAPGCVGRNAATEASLGGESIAMWVSYSGVYLTNGENFTRITDTANWDEKFRDVDLSGSALQWSKDRQLAVFAYDTNGDGLNDRYALIHLGGTERVRITWDHYGAISCMAASVYDGRERFYSGHETDGNVYLEDNGTTDASNSYDANGTVPLIVKTKRATGDGRDLDVFKGTLRNSAGSTIQAATIGIKAGWDDGDQPEADTQDAEEALTLLGTTDVEFFVGMAGQWMEFTLTHLQAGELSLSFIDLVDEKSGISGRGFGQTAPR